jgi:hypothetical protein
MGVLAEVTAELPEKATRQVCHEEATMVAEAAAFLPLRANSRSLAGFARS